LQECYSCRLRRDTLTFRKFWLGVPAEASAGTLPQSLSFPRRVMKKKNRKRSQRIRSKREPRVSGIKRKSGKKKEAVHPPSPWLQVLSHVD